MGHRLRILAVDDNRTNLHILQVFLKRLGHDVILAENGEQAVRYFVEQSPDLVLLDIMMPVMDGFEAARRIKSLSANHWTPVIFLSALNRDENLLEGLEAGADDYLTKPINFVVLEAKIRSTQRSLQMQQQTVDALRRVQAISDNVLEAIITIDEHGQIVAINRATEAIFGWSSQELIGNNVAMLMPEPDASQHDGYIAAYMTRGTPRIIGKERESEALTRDGRRIPVSLGVSEIEIDGRRMFIGVIRDISERKQAEETLRENARLLQKYYDQTQSEQQLALQLMEMQLHRRGLQNDYLRYKVIPATNFSGDVVAATRSEEGRRYALLADATGHGLAAAISVLPVLAIFYRLASANHSLRDILLELNLQLKESIPVGRFVAATLVCLDEQLHKGEIWNGGAPEAFLLDSEGREIQRFAPENLPLGILDNSSLSAQPNEFTWPAGSQIVLCSDGLLEASNAEGEQLGTSGLRAAFATGAARNCFENIENVLARHLGDRIAADDISLMVIDCP
jgi:PAS domain S-box-containing protein